MVLLDTCTLLWLAGDPASLSERARAAITAEAGGLGVSAISAFEIAVKHRRGKLELPLPPDAWYAEAVSSFGLREIPVDGRCALTAAALPPIHNDPCDRFIIATAAIHGLPILTPDKTIARYDAVRTVW